MLQIVYTDFEKWKGAFCVEDYVDAFGPLKGEPQTYRIAGAVVFDGEETASNIESFIEMAVDLNVPMIRIDYSNLYLKHDGSVKEDCIIKAIEAKLKEAEAAGYEDLHSYEFSYCYAKKI